MHSRRWLVRIAAMIAVLALAAGTAFAQGGATSTIAGSVTDASGGVIPGADVVAKNNATSAESRAVSSEQGTFAIPALNAGTYTVTVTLSGFKTVVLNDVVLIRFEGQKLAAIGTPDKRDAFPAILRKPLGFQMPEAVEG